MLLKTLEASLLEYMLTAKGITRAGKGYNNMDHMDKKVLVSLHPLYNIEMI